MTSIKPPADLSNAMKARIVRAFYDTAERLIEAADTTGEGSPETRQAAREMERLIAESKALTSEDFSRGLSKAAETFLAQIPVSDSLDLAQGDDTN